MSPQMIRRLGMILGALVVLWAGFALAGRSRADDADALELPKVDTAAVDTVVVTRAPDTIRLVQARNAWTVNGHAAAATLVHDLLSALSDTSRSTELVAQNRSSHERFGVSADSGRHVRVLSRGRAMLDAVAGKRTPDFGGVYVKLANQDAVYVWRGGAFADAVMRSADEWRDKRVVAVTPESVAVIELQRGARTYALTRDSTHWTLGGVPADSTAVTGLLDQYRGLEAAGFATAAQSDSVDFTKPTARVRLLGKDRRVVAMIAFDSTASGLWARADSAGAVVRFDPWRLPQLVPADSTLRKK